MRDLFKIAVNNLQKNKKQSTGVIVAVMLVCMLLFLASMAASIYRETRVQEALNYSDFHAILVDCSYSNLSALNDNSKIENVRVINEISSLIINNEYEDVVLAIWGTDLPLEEYITVLEGRLPENDKEIIIRNDYKLQDIKVGDEIAGFTVVGYYTNSKLEEYHGYNEEKLYAYTLRKPNESSEMASFVIKLKSPRNAYKKIKTIAKEIGSDKIFYNDNLLRAYGQYNSYTEQMTRNLFLGYFLAIVSIFCGFIVYNSFNISLNERKKQLGTLRSIGASKKQLYILSMFEMLIIALISIPGAFLFNAGLVYLIVKVVNKLIVGITSEIIFNIYWPYIIVSLAFIIITIFISASISALAASKTSPINLIKNIKKRKIKKVKENYPLIRNLFGTEGELAYKNRIRNSQKFVGPIVTLTLSLILFISVSAYINYLKLNINIDLPNLPDFRIAITKSDVTNPVKVAKQIEEMDYIDDFVEYKTASSSIKVEDYFTVEAKEKLSNDSNLGITIYALDDDSFKKYQQKLNTNSETIFYNYYQYYENSDIATSIYLLEKNVQNITLIKKWTDKEDTSLFNIYNIFVTNDNYLNTFSYPGIVMSMSNYEKNYDILPIRTPSENSEYFENYNNMFRNKINVDLYSKKYKKLNVILSKYIDNQAENDIFYDPVIIQYEGMILLYNLVTIGLFSVIGFVGLIASLSIFNSISANMNLRAREFSMLRSMGLSHKLLLKVVNLESSFLILTTLLYGLPISYFIVHFLMKVSNLHRYSGKVYMHFPTLYAIIAVVFLILLVLVIMLYNYKKLKKKNIIEAIREEI